MGGGREILTLISTAAIVGMGTTIANAKSIVPKSNFFILLPPLVAQIQRGFLPTKQNSSIIFGSSCRSYLCVAAHQVREVVHIKPFYKVRHLRQGRNTPHRSFPFQTVRFHVACQVWPSLVRDSFDGGLIPRLAETIFLCNGFQPAKFRLMHLLVNQRYP
jgi:hypothetical protein